MAHRKTPPLPRSERRLWSGIYASRSYRGRIGEQKGRPDHCRHHRRRRLVVRAVSVVVRGKPQTSIAHRSSQQPGIQSRTHTHEKNVQLPRTQAGGPCGTGGLLTDRDIPHGPYGGLCQTGDVDGRLVDRPISDPAQLAGALKRALAIVKSGAPALVDVLTQPR